MKDESIIRQYKCSSRASSANKRFEEKISSLDVLLALKKNDFKCFYCNDNIDFRNWQLDHFFPRANNGKNSAENLVACCKWCNTMKNALCGNSFINKCSEIVSNNFFVKNNFDAIKIIIKGRGHKSFSFLKELKKKKLQSKIIYFENKLPLVHNGCRPPKKRRL